VKHVNVILVIVGGDMTRFKWLPLDDVVRSIPVMDKYNVSRVARGLDDSEQTKEGFIEAYIAVKGDKNKMMTRITGRMRKGQEVETWADRRNQFVARHLKQMRQGDTYSNGWLPSGEPTRRHLALIAWAYSPSPKRLKDWLNTQEAPLTNPKTIRSAIHRIDSQGVHEKIGFVVFSDSSKGLKIDVDVSSLPNGEHGFHVHEYGSIEPKMKDGKMVSGLSAGQHYDPLDAGFHGSPTGCGHLGDLPFITVKNGTSKQTVYAPRLSVKQIENRAIIIHEGGDNYSDTPLPNGGGKSRIAGGIITNGCPYCVSNPKFTAKKLENILYDVYRRGSAAWASGGHRKFQTPQSWGHARVNSFLVGGKTFFTGDKDLAKKLPTKLYEAIYKERTYDPPKSLKSDDKKVIRDSRGLKIPQKYLDGFKGKDRDSRIKEIDKRRREYSQALKKYGDEKDFPQKVLDQIYSPWDSDKGTSKIKSPYTIEAHKRGFTGSRLEKSKEAINYYMKRKNPSKSMSVSDKDIINALSERFKSLNNQLPKWEDIKWKKGKDFDMDGTWETEIGGKIYDIYRDATSGIYSSAVWYLGRKSEKIFKISKSDILDILGYTKKEATKKLVERIKDRQSKK